MGFYILKGIFEGPWFLKVWKPLASRIANEQFCAQFQTTAQQHSIHLLWLIAGLSWTLVCAFKESGGCPEVCGRRLVERMSLWFGAEAFEGAENTKCSFWDRKRQLRACVSLVNGDRWICVGAQCPLCSPIQWMNTGCAVARVTPLHNLFRHLLMHCLSPSGLLDSAAERGKPRSS